MIAFDFFPDPARAIALDKRMHRELGLSLAHVCEASKGKVEFEEQGMQNLLTHLANGGPAYPATFARYYDLVRALMADDDALARKLFAELAAAVPPEPGLQIFTLGAADLGEDSARYCQMMNADPSLELGFQAPEPEAAAAFRQRLSLGMDLLERTLPNLAGEIRAIIRQIVISGSDPARRMQFDGGSHFQLWGALFLNANFHETDIAVAEVLAHESAHSLLFGFCTHEPLVENADDELFSSPLRVDKRPMDGIYHATFVSARMHWAMSQLAHSPELSSEKQALAHEAAEADLKNFRAGIGVVKEHGKLTALGKQLMDEAEDYMSAAAAA